MTCPDSRAPPVSEGEGGNGYRFGRRLIGPWAGSGGGPKRCPWPFSFIFLFFFFLFCFLD
jgi:hypothetical protein